MLKFFSTQSLENSKNFFCRILKTMPFFKIQDPNRRDEVVREMNERRKRIYHDSISDSQMINNNISSCENPLIQNDLDKISMENQLIQKDLDKLKEDDSSRVQTSEGGSLMNVGEVAKHYLKMYTSNTISNKNQMDKSFGVKLKEGEFFIGREHIMINNDDIIIGDKLFRGTTGLWELITKLEPDATLYNDEDYKNYREILIDTNAIGSDSNPNKPKASRGEKYRKIIKPLWKEIVFRRRGKKGNGVIILPSDPNALIERFTLSVAAGHAGNKGSRNESVSICDELLRQHVIDKDQYNSMIAYIDAK